MTTIEELELITKRKIHEGKRFVPPHGNTSALVMVVIDKPDFDDIKEGCLLAGKSGKNIKDIMLSAGIPVDECWFTSILKMGIGNKKVTAATLREQESFIQRELELIKPSLVVTLGGEAFKYFYGVAKFDEWIGMIIDGKYGKMIATHSPFATGVADPLLRLDSKKHFTEVVRYVCQHTYDTWTYEVVTDPKRNLEILSKYLADGKRKIAYDAEWLPGVWNTNEVMTDFQYAMEPNHAVILNLSDDLQTENKELLDTMKLVLEREDIKMSGWNIKGELKRLRHRGFNFHDGTLGFDGMVATALIDSRHGKGLDHGVFNYTNLPPYWIELYEILKKNKVPREEMVRCRFLDKDTWHRYCSGDAVAHFQVNEAMERKLLESPETVQRYYNEVYLPSMWFIQDMEIHGLPMDIAAMEDMTLLYKEGYRILLERLVKYAEALGLEDYNPHAWQHTNRLFFDTLKIPPGMYTKKTKAKSRFWYAQASDNQRRGFKPSTNAKSLAVMQQDLKHSLAEHPDDVEIKHKLDVITCQIDLNKVNVFANKFLNKEGTKYENIESGTEEVAHDTDTDEAVVLSSDEEDVHDGLKTSYWNALGKNDRVYTDVYPCLDNFRWSTKPNTQVLPAKASVAINRIYRELEPELKCRFPELKSYVPDNIRNMLWSGDKDWLYMEADCLSADLGHLGYLAKDPVLLSAVREKAFHVEMAKIYFDDPTITKERSPDLIVASKSYSFGSTYSSCFASAAFAIQGALYSETGIFKTQEDIENSLTKGWGQYRNYTKFKKDCEDMVRSRFYIENGYGMRLTFEPTEDYTTLARYINRALAWPPASSLATHMTHVAHNTRQYFKYNHEWGKWINPVNACHDSHAYVFHKDLLKDNYIQNVIFAMFSKITPISTGDFVGVDMDIAPRWKGKTVWSGKTKWINNEWVLQQTGGD